MAALQPFQFTSFDDQPPVVFDLAVNRPQVSANDDVLLQKIADELKLLLAENQCCDIKLVRMILGELSPVLLQKNALAVAAEFLAAKFPALADEKVLDFYFHSDIIYRIQPRLAALAEQNHFEGQLRLHKDDSLQPCDCRIKWGHKSCGTDSGKRLQAILQALSATHKEDKNEL